MSMWDCSVRSRSRSVLQPSVPSVTTTREGTYLVGRFRLQFLEDLLRLLLCRKRAAHRAGFFFGLCGKSIANSELSVRDSLELVSSITR